MWWFPSLVLLLVGCTTYHSPGVIVRLRSAVGVQALACPRFRRSGLTGCDACQSNLQGQALLHRHVIGRVEREFIPWGVGETKRAAVMNSVLACRQGSHHDVITIGDRCAGPSG